MNVYSEINSNKLKTYIALILFVVFVSFVAFVIGKALGLQGGPLLILAFFISLFFSFISYFFSDKIVLSLHGARPANREEHFDLYTVTENLALAAGLPKPRVYIIPDAAPNAFATGRDYKHAVVVVTQGLLEVLDRRELEGVIAHELSHIKNYDILLMTVVSVLVGVIVYLTDFFMRSLWWRNRDNNREGSAIMMVVAIVVAVLSPILATLLQLAVSRRREFLADASAAYITRYPTGLASALEKIAQNPHKLSTASNGTAHMFIENPFGADRQSSKTSWWIRLFSTHPPVEERIAKLQGM